MALVMKYKAHKKTSLTMEEKWGRVSHELFTLDTFRDFVELDGYTLQKKFSRLKRKIVSKYQIYSSDFDLDSLPAYADDLERVVAKLLVEGLAEKANGKDKKDKTGRSRGDESDFEDNEEENGAFSASKAERSELKKRPRSDSDSEESVEVLATAVAGTEEDVFHPNQPSSSLSAAELVSDGKKSDSNRYRLELLEFEKEKERKRIAHQERMELMKLEYEMKQNLLKLEAETKQAEAQIKLADAHKAQAEVTAALLAELQRMRSERDGKK